MQRLGLVERARRAWSRMLKAKLKELKAKHPSIVGDVRGKGLFWAVDLVKDQNHEGAVQHLLRIRSRGSRCWWTRLRGR